MRRRAAGFAARSEVEPSFHAMPAVLVNGDSRQIEAGTSVAALLEALELPREGVAVEINRAIIPRRLHPERLLEDGDEIEIVTFVGGG
jgi:sulfur carrier protein